MWLLRVKTLIFSLDSLYSILSWGCAIASIYALNRINEPLASGIPADGSVSKLFILVLDIGILTGFFLCFGIRKAPGKRTPHISLPLVPANLASLVISALIFLAIPLDWLFSITSVAFTPILAIALIASFLLIHHVINELIVESRLPKAIRYSINTSTALAYIAGIFLIAVFIAPQNNQFSIAIPPDYLVASQWLLTHSFDFALEHL